MDAGAKAAAKTAAKTSGWIKPYLHAYRWQFAAAAILGAIAILSSAALLFTSGYLISRSSLQPENILMVYVPIVLVRAFGFSKAFFQYVERLTGHDAALRILAKMRTRLYSIVEPQALTMRSKYKSGDLLGLLAEDIEQLQNIFLKIVLPALSSLLVYGTAIVMLGRFDGSFALLMALYSGLWLFLMPLVALRLSIKRRRSFKAKRNQLYTKLTDALYGMSDWTLSGRSAQFIADFAKDRKEMTELDNKLRRWEWNWQLMMRCSTALAVIMMAVWAADMAAGGTFVPSFIAAMALVAMPIMDAFVKTGDAVYHIPDYSDSLRRLKQLEQTSGSNKREISAAARHAEQLQEQLPPEEPLHQVNIKIEQMDFTYDGALVPTLQQISLNAPQGASIAVLGRSGSGKSTLLNLMLGELAPNRGTITVNGLPAYQLEGADFSVLNQKPYLFDTTVANNIRLGKPDATDEEVRHAAEQVGLHAMIESLPDGYHTRMEETGSRFSGGERQRIALARILLQNRPVVLLDEPSVGLDTLTERKLMATMFEVLKGKTLIWFTHHLSGMEKMDEILFLEEGKVLMRGRHEQLLAAEPRYRRLYELDDV